MEWKWMREGKLPLFIIFWAAPDLGRDAIFSRTPLSMGADGKGGEDKIN